MSEQCATDCPIYHGVEGEIVTAEQIRDACQARLSRLDRAQEFEDTDAAAKIDHLREWGEELPPEASEIIGSLVESAGKVYGGITDEIEERGATLQSTLDAQKERIERLGNARDRAHDNCPGWKKGGIMVGRLIMDNRIVHRPSTCRGEIEEELDKRM